MKLIACVLLAVALAQAADYKPVHIHPEVPFGRLPFHRPDSRITGGQEATPHAYPYQVALFIPTAEGTSFCGGSLLSTTTVVTAAHCAELSTEIEVVLGAHRIRDEEPSQVRVQAEQVIVHSGWDSATLHNDIAILRIPAVELNENIGVIALPSTANAGSDYVGDVATASGWGKDSDEATSISDVLNYVEVPVGSNHDCNVYYFGVIVSTHICTDGANGKSTCSGDSGGPLRASTGELIGITSFGISFGCTIGWPAVFTRVTEYRDWIAENSDVVLS